MNFRSGGGGGDGEVPPLVRQGSIYSLTFDEFQSTLGGVGKDFGSMNMDELLKNIWTAEESYAMAVALGDGSGGAGAGAVAGLQRQGSLTFPRTLSQKTVDEVWRDLVGPSSSGQGPTVGGGPPVGGGADVPREPTLGEITLEEFLVRAGVVREDMSSSQGPQRPADSKSNNASVFFGDLAAASGSSSLALGFNHGPSRISGNIVNAAVPHSTAANLRMTAAAVRPYAVDLGNQQGMTSGGLVGFGNTGLNNGLMAGMVGLATPGVVKTSGSPVNPLSSDGLGKGNGELSSVSPVPYSFSGGIRGRKSSGTLEKVVERRQRRMIKNRESAARSRARKQAYTMELEAEIAKLKEQNQELQKKQAEMIEKQKNQILEMINQQTGSKKRCLRRTLTGPW